MFTHFIWTVYIEIIYLFLQIFLNASSYYILLKIILNILLKISEKLFCFFFFFVCNTHDHLHLTENRRNRRTPPTLLSRNGRYLCIKFQGQELFDSFPLFELSTANLRDFLSFYHNYYDTINFIR